MKTARHEPLKSQGGDRLLLGGGCLFEHGRKLNAFFREEQRDRAGLGGEEGKWVGDRRDKKAGEEGRQEGKEQGRRGRRKGKEKGPEDEKATSIPGATVITCCPPGRAALKVGGGGGAVVPNPARSLVICCLISSLLQT